MLKGKQFIHVLKSGKRRIYEGDVFVHDPLNKAIVRILKGNEVVAMIHLAKGDTIGERTTL